MVFIKTDQGTSALARLIQRIVLAPTLYILDFCQSLDYGIAVNTSWKLMPFAANKTNPILGENISHKSHLRGKYLTQIPSWGKYLKQIKSYGKISHTNPIFIGGCFLCHCWSSWSSFLLHLLTLLVLTRNAVLPKLLGESTTCETFFC